MHTKETRQIKRTMLIAFALAAWVILFANYSVGGYETSWIAYLSTPMFTLLAFLYWRKWEPAAYIVVVLVSVLVAIIQSEPFVTQQASLLIFLPPILAIVLLPPGWMIIIPSIVILTLLAHANWRGVYADPVFLAIYITLTGGLLISRRVLDLNVKQLEALNRILEQRINERTGDLQHALVDLRASEGRLRTLVTNVPLILCSINQKGVFTAAEGRGLTQLAIEPHDLIGQSVFQLYSDHPQIIVDTKDALAGKQFSTIHHIQEASFETWYTPILEPDGSISGITSVSIDITKRQRAEEELARSLKFAQSINETTPDIVYVYDLNANQTISSNRSILTMLGYTPEQIQHMDDQFFPRFIHQDDLSRLPEQYHRLAQLDDRAIHSSEYRLRTADGGWRWFASREVIFQRKPDGSPELVLGIATDITERKTAEDAIRQHSEELAQANRELAQAARLKDEFLASMSHELRTPLTSILGRAELLQEELSGSLTSFQRRSVRGIEESGRHLLALINDILDFSKIEAGKMTLEIQPIPIASLVQTCVGMITETAHQKNLHVHTTVDQTVATIAADPRRLKQILVNLLGNAVKFTPDGGEIGLDIHANPAAKTIDLSVWDTGIGIDAADHMRLFQPFVQIDSGLARQYEGTGLGLALVERLTSMHGGWIDLISEVGHGSRFTITLPLQPINDQPADLLTQPTDAHVPVDAGTHLKNDPPPILLVEDTHETRAMLAEYLELHGYRVLQAVSSHDGLMQAHNEQPILIIIDIQLPDMDGLTTIRHMRRDQTLVNIPIIVLSAHASSNDHKQSMAAGANAYLSKPVRLTELLSTMTALRNQHPHHPQ